jgi:hypothetical protein
MNKMVEASNAHKVVNRINSPLGRLASIDDYNCAWKPFVSIFLDFNYVFIFEFCNRYA